MQREREREYVCVCVCVSPNNRGTPFPISTLSAPRKYIGHPSGVTWSGQPSLITSCCAVNKSPAWEINGVQCVL
eukprot:COSAG05_NODE_1696_length_4261_cov_2.865596_4_plen_74_part_00